MVILSELVDQPSVSEEGMNEFSLDSHIWDDVVPVAQDDGPQPLCPILYDPDCMCVAIFPTYTSDAKAISLYRALMSKDKGSMEVSDRALALTELLVHMNPANYTVWQSRAQVLIRMASRGDAYGCLQKELEFLDRFALINMKNYQVWYVWLS